MQHKASRRRRRLVLMVVLVVAALLVTPIPWLLPQENTWGMAWRLDGRLLVNGEIMDPAGRWTWLTAGRPPILAETLFGGGSTRDLRGAPAAHRPEVNEPMAAAVGLAHAGYDIEMGLIVEARVPTLPDLPGQVTVVEVNGIALTNLEAWHDAMTTPMRPMSFRTDDDQLFTAPGPNLPYEQVHVIDLAPEGIDAVVGGNLATAVPFRWFRSLALGRSHGLIVALVTYAHYVDRDLAEGLHVAATGGIRGDGTVGRIGGLPAKAEAAKKAGADVLLFPAIQEVDLVAFDPGAMKLIPVTSLTEAITQLGELSGR